LLLVSIPVFSSINAKGTLIEQQNPNYGFSVSPFGADIDYILLNRETKTLFRTFISMLVVFVVGMFFLGMFVFGILLSYSLPYLSVDFATLLPILMFLGSLCFVSGVGLIVKAGVLAIHKGRIGNIGQKGYSSRVVAEAYRKPWKLVG
jgi:hypothetical protein